MREIIYVGSTTDLGIRLNSHRIKKSRYHFVYYVDVPADLDRFEMEYALIAIFQPRLNRFGGRLWCSHFSESTLEKVVDRFLPLGWTLLDRKEILSKRLPQFERRTHSRPYRPKKSFHPRRITESGLSGKSLAPGDGMEGT